MAATQPPAAPLLHSDEESTMDQARIVEMALRIEHRHGDGSWGEFQEDRSHHSPSDHDPERLWGIRRIFRCTSCDDSVTIIEGDEGGAAAER
jgi:hypothetical protein